MQDGLLSYSGLQPKEQITTVKRDTSNKRILGIDPCPRGFGFAVFDMPEFLCDWGVARVFSKDAEAYVVRVTAMITRYSPDVVAVPDPADFKGKAILRKLVKALTIRSSRRPIVRIVSKVCVQNTFPPENRTKYHRAVLISRALPELEALLPRPRKIWESEDARMNIFDALSLILATPEGCVPLPISKDSYSR